MKTNIKILLVLLLSIIISNKSNAQIKVFQNGTISMGGTAAIPWPSILQVAGNAIFSQTQGSITSAAYIRGLNNYSTVTTPDYTWFNNDRTGIFHPSSDVIAFSINGAEKMRIDNGYNGRITIGGGAPYWNGALTVNGSAYSSVAWYTYSDKRYKKNIKPIENALTKVLKLNGKSYEYNIEEFKSLNFNNGTAFGFIAQEVADIIPEAVQKDSNGFYSMNYDAVIPVLVEAIKEQENKIAQLQTNLNSCCKTNNKSSVSGGAANPNSNDNHTSFDNSINPAVLYQNTPNPFSQQTQIKCFIPDKAMASDIFIYDMQGTQIKKIQINGKGIESINIQGSELKAGMYMYTLIIDGKEIDTKKMILTN